MSARAAPAGGLLAAALARAEAWLLEPAEPVPDQPRAAPPQGRPVVSVFGLGRGCGVTTVARALATELAARDQDGAAAVASPVPGAAIPLASVAAGRLARALEDLPGARVRPLGRLCLVEGADPLALADAAREVAPLVIDAGSCVGGVPAAVADHTVLVAGRQSEPALAAVAADCLARVGPQPALVVNRPPAGDWQGRGALELPESRMGAQLALGGREPRGQLGRAIAELCDLLEAP